MSISSQYAGKEEYGGNYTFYGVNKMDNTFKTDEGIFNYRVCGIIINENRLLANTNASVPYYYLPGGRVKFNETAEQAVLREIKEELRVTAEVIRPLWLNESFFTEEASHERFHELCLYFLMDITKTDLLSLGDSFVITEDGQPSTFQWIKFEELDSTYLYPLFIKDKLNQLPQTLEMNLEIRE